VSITRCPVGLSGWHAIGEFLDEDFIFLLTSGSNLRIFIDHRSINFFEGVPDSSALVSSAQPVPSEEPGVVAKGTETRSPALGNIIGAELKWLDPH